MDAKQETINYVKKIAQYFKKNTNSLSFENKLNYISMRIKPHYGLSEQLMDDKILRYPHEAKSMATCFDSAVLFYLILKEMGYNCQFNEIKANYIQKDSNQEVDHSIIIVENKGKKYLFDPVMSFEGECELTLGKISLKGQDKHIDLESIIECSEDKLFEKLEYYQTPEGKILSLEQEFKVSSNNYSVISMNKMSYLRFNKEKKAIENINFLDLRYLGKKKIIVNEYFDSTFDIDFYDEINKNYEKAFSLSQEEFETLDELIDEFILKTKYEDYEKIDTYLKELILGDSETINEIRNVLDEQIFNSLNERNNLSYINFFDKVFSKEILDFFTFYKNPRKELSKFNSYFRKLAKKYYKAHEFSKSFITKCKALAYYENKTKPFQNPQEFSKLLIDEKKRVINEIFRLELEHNEFLFNEKDFPKELEKDLNINYTKNNYLNFFSSIKNANYLDFDKYFGLYLANEEVNKFEIGEFEKLIENEDALQGYYERIISMIGIYYMIKGRDLADYEKEKMKKIIKEYYNY